MLGMPISLLATQNLESKCSITGYGDSASTLSSHASAIRCYEKYRVTCNLPELSSISRGAFCCDEFFQKFAYYLTDVYKTKFGDPLTKGSALGYIGCILIHGETKLFKGIKIVQKQISGVSYIRS